MVVGILAIVGAAFGRLYGSNCDLRQVGIESINSDFATFFRAAVTLLALSAILMGTGQWQPVGSVSART